MGRVEWLTNKISNSNGNKIAYDYDLQGNIIKVSYLDYDDLSNNFYTFYTYDAAGRLNKIETDKVSTYGNR